MAAGEMAAKAKQWAASTPPKIYALPEIKSNLAKLVQESNALAAFAKSGTDAQIKQSLSALHDRFHEIAGMCRDAKNKIQ